MDSVKYRFVSMNNSESEIAAPVSAPAPTAQAPTPAPVSAPAPTAQAPTPAHASVFARREVALWAAIAALAVNSVITSLHVQKGDELFADYVKVTEQKFGDLQKSKNVIAKIASLWR